MSSVACHGCRPPNDLAIGHSDRVLLAVGRKVPVRGAVEVNESGLPRLNDDGNGYSSKVS
jgi:hypothetical protein